MLLHVVRFISQQRHHPQNEKRIALIIQWPARKGGNFINGAMMISQKFPVSSSGELSEQEHRCRDSHLHLVAGVALHKCNQIMRRQQININKHG